MRLFIFILLTFFSNISYSEISMEQSSDSWIMIEVDDFFLSSSELEIEEKVIELVESNNLGEFDGHSSGQYQFDMNLYDVPVFEEAKTQISRMLKAEYPKLNFIISDEYETIFDSVE